MPPKGKGGLTRGLDDYAAHRCACKHLVYAGDKPGGKCRFCPCDDHRPRGTETQASDSPAGAA